MEKANTAHIPPSSESASIVKVSSPLNPSSPRPECRRRGHSVSTLGELPTSPLLSAPTSSLAIAILGDKESSSFRSRSRSKSPGVIDESVWKKSVGAPTSLGESASTWWGKGEFVPRPWKESPKRRHSLPAEQKEGWVLTRQRVAQAASSILGNALDVGHEALVLSQDLLEFAPVPGLQSIAGMLLQIWDTLQLVDMNRLQCLRLTERCANILLSIRQEIHEAGDMVGTELSLPISKLTDAFNEVYVFLQKQIHRPFLKRYLRRDEILRQIAACDSGLQDAMETFGLSIQIRILKQVQASEQRRQKDTEVIIESLRRSNAISVDNALQLTGIREEETTPKLPALLGLPGSGSYASLNTGPFKSPSSASLSLPPEYHFLSTPPLPASSASSDTPTSPRLMSPAPATVLPTLKELSAKQNEHDMTMDAADLRALLRNALSAGSDVQMVETLGVTREEMPEAIKTLQRALEKIVERQGSIFSSGDEADVEDHGVGSDGPSLATLSKERGKEVATDDAESISSAGHNHGKLIKMVRRISMQGREAVLPVAGEIKRSKTVSTTRSSTSDSSTDSRRKRQEISSVKREDTLDQEFMESGIDALRRMSEGAEANLNLPSWTITRYEVDREQKIGIGFFSDVYRGTWRKQTVAIKVLAETTPRNLFIREVGIWKTLQHPNVLELYGASSASGDPPWFFVSPYLKNGTLVEFLRGMDGGKSRTGSLPDSRNSMGASPGRAREAIQRVGLGLDLPTGRGRSDSIGGDSLVVDGGKGWDLLKFMHEVAKGMAYLHSKGVLHGDLKASNVLVDDRLRCVISDFGQSEMKSEAFRISGTPLPHGTLRWQAPELMMGLSQLTTEMDVYAFAMCCIEILSMGRLPWPFMDDDTVRHFVLREDSRPVIPSTRFSTSALQKLIRACWQKDPFMRPNFSTVVQELKQMRKSSGLPEEVVLPKFPERQDNESFEFRVSRPSPDMHPVPLLPGTPPRDLAFGPLQGSPSASFRTARDMSASPPMPSLPFREAPMNVHMPEPMAYISSAPLSRASSTAESTTPSSQSEDEIIRNMMEYDGYDSPPVADKRIAEARDERRYRLLLTHKFHPSLTLPLWTPSQVYLGAVGYLQKPEGAFVTLFNCVNPEKSPDEHPTGMPSVHGYGKITAQNQRLDQRSAAQRGLDAFTNIFRKNDSISSRRYSHPLRAGHKTAFLYTETTVYTYVENLDAPKKWFKANVDEILATYGTQHRIQKEDLFLVIGTLTTPDYALFVSHRHPDGQAYFNVLPPRNGQPWGVIKTDNEVPSELGPSYHEDLPFVSASKVSRNGSRDVTILIARLRFKPDVLEPTSL
ncbi:uncharacterized protein BT62DRAFT_995815 [Guyanagaster necrorhizus]|uniref:Protein kinase domain-containing protein n=1 Tax=Guyanagaster necrorhizus TaxID=856835 RepID=A0A9P8AQ99_9AGAR|nr:uncharacterized protein BT62DRAFT_995815 [Guyanagaster necrorhizus MCA 3950]KAG7443780.1 hypothetical protein BT62DRAFT_995815 [Guyanagaster necrorhizus MCA 3950]